MFVSKVVALLSLLTPHLQPISSLPNPDNTTDPKTVVTVSPTPPSTGDLFPPFDQKPFYNGIGPQVTPDTPRVPTPPQDASQLQKHFAWDPRLHIDKGRNVTVVHARTGVPAYIISSLTDDHRATIISNIGGKELLRFRLEKSRGGFRFTYHTSANVSYTIHPRGLLPDHWVMQIEGSNPDVSYEHLEYYRARFHNTGKVAYHVHNRTEVAEFKFIKNLDKTHWTNDTLPHIRHVVQLDITHPTNIPDEYFIGLWCLVKRRIDYHGK